MTDRGGTPDDEFEPPVWDGQGFDPWLPQRLRDAAQVARSEREMFDAFWALLSEFLVAALRLVSGSTTPDPTQVLGAEGLWNQLIDEFVSTVVRDVIGSVYQAIFGPDVRFDSRPFVVNYLAQVENRLRNVDNEVYNRVAQTVARGAAEGWSVPRTSQELEEVLSVDNPIWKNRATVVARTETIGALNAGRTDSFEAIADAIPELRFEQQWLATLDHRVRDTHRRADGQRRPMGAAFSVGTAELRFPGDPRGPAEEVIQCRCTTILVEEGREVDMTNRGFRDIQI